MVVSTTATGVLTSVGRKPRPREVKTTVRYWSPIFILLLAAVAIPERAFADTIDRLANTLRRSKSEKARMSAAVALSKSRDSRAVPALAAALRDRSKTVRAVAATGLGMHADRRALKALRRATRDPNELVRRKATAAISKILSSRSQPRSRTRRRRDSEEKLDNYSVAGKESPLVRARRPSMHVMLKSASDDTRGSAKKSTRKRRARQLKSLMMAEMIGAKSITTKDAVATELGLRSYAVDLSLTKLERSVHGSMVELECEIRVTISNARGKMISFLTGGAKIQVPRRSYRHRYLRQMRKEALENAVRKMYLDLLSFLRHHDA